VSSFGSRLWSPPSPRCNHLPVSESCAGPRLSRASLVNLSRIATVSHRRCAIARLQTHRKAAGSRASCRNAVPSQRRRTSSFGCHELAVHSLQSPTVARSPYVAVAAEAVVVEAELSNSPFKPTRFAASRRLQTAASGAPRLARGLTWRYADRQGMSGAPAIGVLALAIALSGCVGRHVDRSFFANGHGIGITDPIPAKDGGWWMGIEFDAAIGHSGKHVQRWDVEVRDNRIAVRALVVLAGSMTRRWYGPPESGAHIDELSEGEYQVVYRDDNGFESPLGHVTARRTDRLPAPTWQWSGNQRHNNPIKLSVRPVMHLACARCSPVRPAAYRVR